MNKIRLTLLALVAILVGTNAATTQEALGEQDSAPQQRTLLARTFEATSGLVLPYRIHYPADFSPAKQYPLLLFMHGAGERGSDNQLQLFHGGDMLATAPELAEVIIVAPQCPAGEWWADIDHDLSKRNLLEMNPAPPTTAPMLAVEELVGALVGLGFVDTTRIYGVGMSMGAMGLFDLVCRHPQMFAAVQPICGAVNTGERLAAYDGPTAFRLFHGIDDDVVPADCSRRATEVLKSGGHEVELVLYDGCGHLSWHPAFAEEDFLSWMLAKRKM